MVKSLMVVHLIFVFGSLISLWMNECTFFRCSFLYLLMSVFFEWCSLLAMPGRASVSKSRLLRYAASFSFWEVVYVP